MGLVWKRHVGLDGAIVGLDRFGASAPHQTHCERMNHRQGRRGGSWDTEPCTAGPRAMLVLHVRLGLQRRQWLRWLGNAMKPGSSPPGSVVLPPGAAHVYLNTALIALQVTGCSTCVTGPQLR